MSATCRALPVLTAVTLLGASLLSPTAYAAPTPTDRQNSWLAIGDSISSGFGIPETSSKRSAWGQNCRRADGSVGGGDAPRAWPLVAATQLRGASAASAVSFTACAGSITDDWGPQVAEAYLLEKAPLKVPTDLSDMEQTRKHVESQMTRLAASGWRWRVISLTFGANNVDLGGTVERCLDIDRQGDPMTWSSDRWGGCSRAVEALRARIGVLTGASTGELARGGLPLWRADGESLLRHLSSYVTDGGTVLVMGYPQLFAKPENSAAATSWPRPLFEQAYNCDGLTTENIGLIRGAVADLNARTAEAVVQADRALKGRAHVVFVDPNTAYESGDASHGLCAPQPWVNGPFATGALHPEAKGHAAMGALAAKKVASERG